MDFLDELYSRLAAATTEEEIQAIIAEYDLYQLDLDEAELMNDNDWDPVPAEGYEHGTEDELRHFYKDLGDAVDYVDDIGAGEVYFSILDVGFGYEVWYTP